MSTSFHAVTFGLDGCVYALRLSAVDTVVQAVEITPLPHSPDGVAGIINVHGSVVPVFNLRHRFHLPLRKLRLDDYMILGRTSKRRVALVVDSVGEVFECVENIVIPPEAILPDVEYLAGVVTLGDGLILIHDLDSFLSIDEEHVLEEALTSR